MAEVRKNTVHPLHIEGYTAEGMGVARLDGRVVFIPGTIRGEDWEVQLLKVNTVSYTHLTSEVFSNESIY